MIHGFSRYSGLGEPPLPTPPSRIENASTISSNNASDKENELSKVPTIVSNLSSSLGDLPLPRPARSTSITQTTSLRTSLAVTEPTGKMDTPWPGIMHRDCQPAKIFLRTDPHKQLVETSTKPFGRTRKSVNTKATSLTGVLQRRP